MIQGGSLRRRAAFLMGPTAAGKSSLAIQLTREFPLEIVSVDSALVYRGMDIGTAKPDVEVRRTVPHHLIDIRDPETTYSAGEFLLDASAAMNDIWSRGRQPLFVGGTMLYFHALTVGIADLPSGDLAIRADLERHAAAVGWPVMHRELATVDPAAAARIHNKDSQRIQRALEVYRITGQPITRLQQRRTSVLAAADVVEFAVAPSERSVLHARIEARFKAMLACGFVEEVRCLRERIDLNAEHPSMRAVGYRQIWQFLAGQCALSEAVERAMVATRQLAKRQFTWLRARSDVKWVDSAQSDAISALIEAMAASGFAE